MTLSYYRFLTRLLWPAIMVFLLFRLVKGKEDKKRLKERLGYSSLARPFGTLIWVHAASVGESIAIRPLIAKITERYSDVHVLLTTGTVTSAQLMAKTLPARVLHQYIPVDNYGAVKRFLRFWQPQLVLWTESELWPNLVTETAKQCPVVMINGRLSHKSLLFWQRYPLLRAAVMRSFALSFAQSRDDKERLTQMGAKDVQYLGNLKYDAPPLPASSEAVEAMRTAIGGRMVWVAASTHEGEEQQIAEVHLRVKAMYPQLLTIIAPRHPNRGEAIASQLAAQGIKTALRSRQEPITGQTDIYIANTLGELGIFFRISPIVLIGASLIPRGGHNPLEPARFGCAILMGSHVFNFTEICQDLKERGALLLLEDTEALYTALERLFSAPEERERLGANALAMVQDTSLIGEKYMEVLQPYIPTSAPK